MYAGQQARCTGTNRIALTTPTGVDRLSSICGMFTGRQPSVPDADGGVEAGGRVQPTTRLRRATL